MNRHTSPEEEFAAKKMQEGIIVLCIVVIIALVIAAAGLFYLAPQPVDEMVTTEMPQDLRQFSIFGFDENGNIDRSECYLTVAMTKAACMNAQVIRLEDGDTIELSRVHTCILVTAEPNCSPSCSTLYAQIGRCSENN